MPNLLGSLGAGGISYLLRDLFTTTLAAGGVTGTAAEPGPGTRTVTDTGSKISIASGVLTQTGTNAANNDPRIDWGSYTGLRQFGQVLLYSRTTSSAGTDQQAVGVGPTITLFPQEGFYHYNNIEVLTLANGGTQGADITITSGTTYSYAIVLKAAGACFFMKGGAQFPNWTLVWVSLLGSTANLSVYGRALSTAGGAWTMDNVRLPVPLYAVPVLAYDTFTRANGALGTSETTGPDGQVVTGLAWTDQVGTWAITSNKAGASVVPAVATLPIGKLDVLHEAALTRSAGNVGITLRYADSSNYIIAYHDGTNAKLDKVVAGATTSVISAAATYSAGAVMRVVASGTSFQLYYNNAQVGVTSTISDAGLQTGTNCGLYTTDTGNTIDNVLAFPRGTGGEYAGLDAF